MNIFHFKKIVLFILVFLPLLGFSQSKNNRKAETIKVKVAVIYENPQLKQYGNKRMHECFRTPSVKQRIWNDPVKLSSEYEKTLEEVSHNVVDYEVVKEIDADRFFTNQNGAMTGNGELWFNEMNGKFVIIAINNKPVN